MYIDANVFIIDSWPTWDTTLIIIFVNFAALPECLCIGVLSKSFIYNAHLQLHDSSPDDLFPMK